MASVNFLWINRREQEAYADPDQNTYRLYKGRAVQGFHRRRDLCRGRFHSCFHQGVHTGYHAAGKHGHKYCHPKGRGHIPEYIVSARPRAGQFGCQAGEHYLQKDRAVAAQAQACLLYTSPSPRD